MECRPLVVTIGVQFQQKKAQRGDQQHAAVAVLYVGRVHCSEHLQALRIDDDVALLALDVLARVIAVPVIIPLFPRS